MNTKDLIKLYKQYQQSRWYNPAKDLAAFIDWLSEMELTK